MGNFAGNLEVYGVVLALTAGGLLMGCQAEKRADHYDVSGQGVTVTPTEETAAPVRITIMTPEIFRVTATATGSFERDPSLMVIKQPGGTAFDTALDGDTLVISTSELRARVSLDTGAVSFANPDGIPLASERPDRRFDPIELDGETLYAIQQTFDVPGDPGFYGLGQHQNGQMNYAGEDVELAQHNVSIAMPFVWSTADFGVLWDSASITRFGDAREYAPLGTYLTVLDEAGEPGGLTGHYYEGDEIKATVIETDPDYQYLPPDQYTAMGGDRDVFPEPFGAEIPDKIVWTGALEARTSGSHKFRAYGSHYLKIFVDGELVIDRWRQNWNPYYYNFELEMTAGEPRDIRIEWEPNGGYFRLLHLDPLPAENQADLSLFSESDQMIDYYFIHGDTPDDIISGYRTLTGKAVMMPKWAYGFWQSRQRYTTQDELLDVLQTYRERGIGIDNIVLDWFYWPEDQWGTHDFDADRFPDPTAMVEAVHEQNAQIMISVWPKFYPGTDNFEELDAAGFMYQGNLEREAIDWVYPGYANSFYDPYDPQAREIFWRQMQENLDGLGFDAWWMDATEPDIHSNLSHPERKYRMGPTSLGPSSQYFNSYALANAQAVYEGERSGTDPDERVFILTRSGFPGIQRYAAATWSGDIVARWDDLREQVAAGTNMSMAGVPNWTFDIGGFSTEARYSQEDPDHVAEWQELNLRWYQFGAFVPIFRSHGEYPFREVFNIAEEGSEIYDSFIYYNQLRYRLMPYIYSEAAGMYFEDDTLMRGLVMDFEADRNVWDINDQYMFGPAFLVSPVGEFEARERDVYLPDHAGWYDFYTGEFYAGGQTITADAPLSRMPLYVKAGSIVPTGPALEYVDQKPDAPITLLVYAGADGSYTLHLDDGETYAYERGEYWRVPATYDDTDRTVSFGDAEGNWTPETPVQIDIAMITQADSPADPFNRPVNASLIYTGASATLALSSED